MAKIHFNRKTALFMVVIVIGLTGGVLALAQTRGDKSPSSDNQTSDIAEEDNEIYYGPPTEEEQASGDEQKRHIVEQEETPRTNPVKEASIVIADASQYDDTIEIRAFITNVIEDGTCVFDLTKGGKSVHREIDAAADASTTQCGAMDIPRSAFSSSGTWTLTVKYQSASASGEAKDKVEIK